MNVYDTANQLAQEIKASEEFNELKMAKQAINLNPELKNKVLEFSKKRYDVQVKTIETGKRDEEEFKKVQEMYLELLENNDAKKYFEAETKFNILYADVNKIIGDSIRELMV